MVPCCLTPAVLLYNLQGAGVYISFSTVSFYGCSFSFNVASNGGGLWSEGTWSHISLACLVLFRLIRVLLLEDSTLLINGSIFDTNSASIHGGGLRSSRSTLIMTGSTFSSNFGFDGGTLYSYSSSLVIGASVFNSNSASNVCRLLPPSIDLRIPRLTSRYASVWIVFNPKQI